VSPTPGLLARTNVPVAGQADDDQSGVKSVEATLDNGSPFNVAFDEGGHFSFATSLALDGSADGVHTVSARATDQAGNVSGLVNRTFTLDTQAPVVTIQSPATGLVTGTNVTVSGQATDTLSGVASVEEALDSGSFTAAPFDASGQFRFATGLALDGSADGLHTVHFRATDKAGNVSSPVDLAFTLHTIALPVDFQLAAGANLLPQAPGHTSQSIVTLTGTTAPNLSVVLQQTGAHTTADARGAFSFTGVTLTPGDNPFTVTATDSSGNVGTAAHTITRDVTNLSEDGSFTVPFDLPFTVPQQPALLQFSFDNLQFGDPGTFMHDAFEAALVDAQGNPLVLPIAGSHDAFFNITQGQQPVLGANAQQTDNTVSVDLAHIPAGTAATLVVRLVNNDADTGTVRTAVRLDDIEVVPGSLGTPAGTTLPALASPARHALDFTTLSDVTSSLTSSYGQTSFHEAGTVLFAYLTLSNAGTYGVDGPLVAVLEHISDPTVGVRNADGATPQGLPYFDLTAALPGQTLAPGRSTAARRLEFSNPNQVRFTYDLVVLGALNQPPVFTSQPNTEAIPGVPYVYQATSTDPDTQETLTYSLSSAPAGMTVDGASGKVAWSPQPSDLGTHMVALRVDDGRGASAEQDFTVTAISAPPNRPPLFTSTPVFDANVGTPYTYQATATDPDGDPLRFALEPSEPFPVVVNNPSFEDPVLHPGTFVGSVTGWTRSSFGSFATFRPGGSAYPGGAVPDGVNVAAADGGTLSQVLSAGGCQRARDPLRVRRPQAPDGHRIAPGPALGRDLRRGWRRGEHDRLQRQHHPLRVRRQQPADGRALPRRHLGRVHLHVHGAAGDGHQHRRHDDLSVRRPQPARCPDGPRRPHGRLRQRPGRQRNLRHRPLGHGPLQLRRPEPPGNGDRPGHGGDALQLRRGRRPGPDGPAQRHRGNPGV
jgi:hypothetical protein